MKGYVSNFEAAYKKAKEKGLPELPHTYHMYQLLENSGVQHQDNASQLLAFHIQQDPDFQAINHGGILILNKEFYLSVLHKSLLIQLKRESLCCVIHAVVIVT